jgi:hypothetical protein
VWFQACDWEGDPVHPTWACSGEIKVDIAQTQLHPTLSGPSEVTVPDHITLHPDAGRSGLPSSMFSMSVVGGSSLDSARFLGSCDTPTSCDIDVPLSWGDNYGLGPRHFWTELDGPGGPFYSDELTVDVKKTPIQVSLQGPASVVVPNQIPLRVTTDPSLPSSFYTMSILSGDSLQNARLVASCPDGPSSCQTQIPLGWSDQNQTGPRHYWAELDGPGGPFYSDELTVKVRPYIWNIVLATTTPRDDGNGNQVMDVTATADATVPSPSFELVIYNGSQIVANCQDATTCTASGVPANGQYRAVVEAFAKEWGADSYDTLIVAKLENMFANSLDVCTEIGMIPFVPDTDGSSLDNAAQVCIEGVAARLPVNKIVAMVLAAGGAALAEGLVNTTTINYDPSQPTLPPPPPIPPVIYRPTPPDALPSTWDAPIAAIVERLKTLNPALALSDTQVQTIAKRCAWLLNQALIPVSDCGKNGLPIFITGHDAQAAGQHDEIALGGHPVTDPTLTFTTATGGVDPEWVRLHYYSAGWSRNWLKSAPAGSGCDDPRRSDLIQCDEYPPASAYEGGQANNPNLQLIDGPQNTWQGLMLGGFYGAGPYAGRKGCNIPDHGEFLAIPLPDEIPLPLPDDPGNSVTIDTTWLCNRGA